MKKKYFVRDFNGVDYKGKHYADGSLIELSEDMYKSMKESVKLVEATAEEVQAYEAALEVKAVSEQNQNAVVNEED